MSGLGPGLTDFKDSAPYSIIIGHNNHAKHAGVVLIGTDLVSQAPFEVRCGHGENAAVFTAESGDLSLLVDTLREVMAMGGRRLTR